MLKSDMTGDLVIRAAENNERVNAPDPGKNILWSFLIALGGIFVWAISPLGLFFIIGAAIRAVVKSDIIRVFAKIFQIISMSLTFCLFVFFLAVALNSQMMMEISWAWGLAGALGLIFLSQIIVIIKSRKNQPNSNEPAKN
jgi:hypothetical protein